MAFQFGFGDEEDDPTKVEDPEAKPVDGKPDHTQSVEEYRLDELVSTSLLGLHHGQLAFQLVSV